MIRVFVNVRRAGEAKEYDLEVPAEVPSEQLASMIAEGLGWGAPEAGTPIRYVMRAEPSGRVLRVDESLADAGLWDGAHLVFQEALTIRGRVFQPALLESAGGIKYPLKHAYMRIGRGRSYEGVYSSQVDMVDLSKEREARTVSRTPISLVFENGIWTVIVPPRTGGIVKVKDRVLQGGQSCPVGHGDRLEIGKVSLRFFIGSASAASAPPIEEPRGEARAYLVPIAQDGSHGSPIPITSRSTKVGRMSSKCDITLADSSVSRVHACLREDAHGDFWILDENSTHGTFVNDQRVTDTGRKLASGDRIRVGRLQLVFEIATLLDPDSTVF